MVRVMLGLQLAIVNGLPGPSPEAKFNGEINSALLVFSVSSNAATSWRVRGHGPVPSSGRGVWRVLRGATSPTERARPE